MTSIPMSDRCTRCHGAGWLPADRAPKPGTQVPFVPCVCDNGQVKSEEKNGETKSAP